MSKGRVARVWLGLVMSGAAAIAVSPAGAFGEDQTWVGGQNNDDWNTPENWSGGLVPTALDAAIINNFGTARVSDTYLPACRELILGVEGRRTGRVELSGVGHLPGQLTYFSSGKLTVGLAGIGEFVQLSGGHRADSIILGQAAEGTGTYTLLDGLLQANSITVGQGGHGTFSHGGGRSRYLWGGLGAGLTLGAEAGSSGVYHLYGSGDLSTIRTTVGDTGFGLFVQSGGSHFSSTLALGWEIGSLGRYELSGPSGRITDLTAGQSSIGISGTGEFAHSGGLHKTGRLEIGVNATGIGTYELTHSGELLAADVVLGVAGNGRFLQTGGTHYCERSLVLADRQSIWEWPSASPEPGAGRYELGGSGLLVSLGTEEIGRFGAGTFIQTGGEHQAARLLLATNPGASGHYELSGGAKLTASELVEVGSAGSGAFIQSGGTHQAKTLRLGVSPGSNGLYELGGDAFLKTSQTEVGIEGSATFRQTGGTHQVEGIHIGATASYGLEAGSILAGGIKVGASVPSAAASDSTFLHTGGDVSVWQLTLQNGEYTLGDGASLVSVRTTLAGGNPVFHQLGGTHFAQDSLQIGDAGTEQARYVMSGGSLRTRYLRVGTVQLNAGELNVANPGLRIIAEYNLVFYPRARFTAAPDTTIELQGRYMWMGSTQPEDVAGLANTTLIVSGESWQTRLEAAGDADGGAFFESFAFRRVVVGADQRGRVELWDLADNGHRQAGAEAFYTHDLIINSDSTLNVRGLGLFVEGDVAGIMDGWIADGRLFDSTLPAELRLDAVYDAANNWTTLTAAPEPLTLGLLALGGFLAARRRGRPSGVPA